MEGAIIGKVIQASGNAKIISVNGMLRTAQYDDPVFYGDRLLTESNGTVALEFIDHTRMDAGRLSDIVLGQSVFSSPQTTSVMDEVATIQQGLLEDEDYDPTVELTTAAGGGTEVSDGGGGDTVRFELSGMEVLPGSGAETTGVGGTTLIIEDEIGLAFEAEPAVVSESPVSVAGTSKSAALSTSVVTSSAGTDAGFLPSGVKPAVDDQPTANCYIDFVDEFTEGNIITAIEEDLFSGLGLPEDSVGADKEGSITSLTYTNEAGNEETVDIPDGAAGITVDTEHGMLTFNQDGTYQYSVDGDVASLSSGYSKLTSSKNVDDNITLKAFKFGSSYLDADGVLNLSNGLETAVSYQGNGAGVKGTLNGMPAATQINHDKITGESEALAITFDNGPVSEVSFTVSRMFKNEHGHDEAGKWQAFDENGVQVGEGAIKNDPGDPGAVQYTNIHSGSMKVTTEDTGGESFQTIVFTSTYYTEDGELVTDPIKNNDSSDYYVKEISWEQDFEDEIEFTLEDVDGDSDTGSLTFQITDEPEAEEAALAEKLELTDTEGPLPNLDNCDYQPQEDELEVLVPQADTEVLA